MSEILDDLIQRYPPLGEIKSQIQAVCEALTECYAGGKKLLLCGNGGSASDVDHISGELMKAFCAKRNITGPDRKALGDTLADQLQGALPAIPLPCLTSLGTAWANDCDYEYVYAQLTYALGKPGDCILGISTSGKARNIAHAFDVARAKGMTTILLTGRDGGLCKTKADLIIQAPADHVVAIQEYHLPIYHAICRIVEAHFFE